MSTPSDRLGKDARALIRAARGGDDVPPEERRELLEAFARSRRAEGVARSERAGLARVWGGRRAAPPLSIAMAALVLTASLAALAQHQGVFERVGAWLKDVRQVPTESVPARSVPALPQSNAAAPAGAASSSRAPLPLVPPAPSPEPPGELTAPRRTVQRAPLATPLTSRASPRHGSASTSTRETHVSPDATATFDPEELELIAAARTALGERRFDAAREAAARHALRFPEGAFSEEREAILALGECRSQHGNQRAQRFIREWPGALLAERVRRDCGLGSNLVPRTEEPDTH